jgi:PKD repeat protein
MTKTKCAAATLLAVVGFLVLAGAAVATPAAPSITVGQSTPLRVKLTSSTGTHWSWTVVDAAQNVVATSSANPFTLDVAQAGGYTARLDATDDDPLAPAPAHAEKALHVYAAPVANFTSSVGANGLTTFADASTGEPTTWHWTFPNGTVSKVQSPPPQSLPVGTSSVTLKVTNPAGANKIVLPVVVNGAPVPALSILSTPAGISSPVLLDARGSTDPNGDALEYSWDLDGNGAYGDAAGPVQSVSYPAAGTYRVGVQVSDGHGGVGTAIGVINVLMDRAPSVSFTNTPETPVVGNPVTFAATAADADGVVTRIDWDLDNDGQFDDAAGPAATWTFPVAGPQIVAVRATDDRGVATIAFRTITVKGAPLALLPASVTEPPTGSSGAPPSPSSAPAPIPLRPAPSSTRPAALTPFPVVRIRGLIFHGKVQISILRVDAPPGATVRIVCRGRSCRAGRSVLRVKMARKPMRARSLEHRSLAAGTVIEVFVTAPHLIGKYTRFTVRGNAAPARSDLCLQPGHQTPTACPTR